MCNLKNFYFKFILKSNTKKKSQEKWIEKNIFVYFTKIVVLSLHSISISSTRERTRFFRLPFLAGGGRKFCKNSIVFVMVSTLIFPIWSRSKYTTGTGGSVAIRFAHWQRLLGKVTTSIGEAVVVVAVEI